MKGHFELVTLQSSRGAYNYSYVSPLTTCLIRMEMDGGGQKYCLWAVL